MRVSRAERIGDVMAPLVAGALVIAALVTPAASATGCRSLGSPDWQLVDVPRFPEGDQVILDYEVSRTDPRIILVTNGRSVLSSKDGGCSFTAVFALKSAGLSYQVGAGITDLLLGSLDGRAIYLAIEGREVVELPLGQSKDLGPRPHVVASFDGGASWSERDQGLESAVGTPLSLSSTPGSRLVYLLVDEAETRLQDAGVVQPQSLYVTVDGGRSWRQGAELGSAVSLTGVAPQGDEILGPAPRFTSLAADPGRPQRAWLYGPRGLYVTIDSGASIQEVRFDAAPSVGPIGAVELFADKDATQMLVFSANVAMGYYVASVPALEYSSAYWSAQPFETPDIITSAALTSGVRFAAGTVGGDAYYYYPHEPEPYDISPAGRAVLDLQRSSWQGEELIYGRTQTDLLRRTIPPPPHLVIPPTFEGPKRPAFQPVTDLPGLKNLKDPKLLPRQRRIVLAPGERRVLPYRLLLPGVIKADVVFLVDVSNSMTEEIDGLRGAMEHIIEVLAEAGISAYVGVAQYRAYDSPPAYERLQDLSPPDDPGVRSALNELTASGGGKETQLAALYQVATGAGQDDEGAYIAPGQQMNFRRNALHIVVHGSDEEFTVTPPNPTFEQAASALRGVRARQVGLAYENEDTFLDTTDGYPTEALGRMALLTGALAPEGVDCNDDGAPDIPAGAPLVCVIPSGDASDMVTSMGSAIANLVKSVPDRRRVELVAARGGEVVDAITPAVYPGVDFKVAQGLLFDVIASCPGPGVYDVELQATARGLAIASSDLRVVCASPARRPPVPPVALLAPPPGRPPPPPQAPKVQSPVQQLQAQSQAQSQAQPQAGMVTQRQSQPQAAAVKVRRPGANLARASAEGQREDLAFTRYRRGLYAGSLYTWAAYAIACAVGAAYGLLLRARHKPTLAPARCRIADRSRRRA